MSLLYKIKTILRSNAPNTVIDSSGKIENKLPVCIFFDNVLLGKPSELTVRTDTIEGIPGIRHITYDGTKIKYTLDLVDEGKAIHNESVGNRFVKEKKVGLYILRFISRF